MTDWKMQRKIVSLPGIGVTPQVALARTLEKHEHIKSVFISIEWTNGAIAADFSSLSIPILAAHALHTQYVANQIMHSVAPDDSDG